MANAARDNNYVPVLLGVTDDANLTPTQLIVDPTTKRLKVSAIITSGGGITSLTGITTGSQTLQTGSAGADFNIVAGTYHTFNIPNASASNRGLLISADWSTFNTKLGTANVGGTANQVIVSVGNGTIVLSTPQNIGTASAPTFGSLTLTNVAGTSVLVSDGNGLIGKATIGNSLSLTGVTLDAIQDLRTSASPTFASPIFTGTLTLNSVKGTAIGSDIQAFDADLTALAALSGTGFAARTGANTWAQRSLIAPAAGITISNPDGIAGNPTLALANDLSALEALSGTGYISRTGSETYSLRNFVAGTNIGVSQGDGVSGNTTIGVVTAPTFAGLVTANLGLTTKGTILAELQKGTAFAYNGVVANGNSGTNFTINWTSGNKQALTLNASPTLTFTAPEGAASMQLILTQNDGGAYTVTWPSAVKISGGTALTSGTNKVDVVSFLYNPTSGSYYTMISTNF